METFKDRAKKICEYERMSMAKFQESLGLSIGHFYNTKHLTRKVAKLIEEIYPEINVDWLATGNGQMVKNGALPKYATEGNNNCIPLLPLVSQGAIPNAIETILAGNDCEKIITPIQGVDLAVSVYGDSMSPELPNGSKVLVQKINDAAFVEWGCTYLLDTVNGIVLKNVFQGKDNADEIICRSVNPNFTDFTVSISDIRAWYRVRCCIIIK